MPEHTYYVLQVIAVVSACINIGLLLMVRNCVGDYRKALISPALHWLAHVVIFYVTWLIFHETSSFLREYHVYWSAVLRLHGQIAIGATIVGVIGREGLWNSLLQKIPRLRS